MINKRYNDFFFNIFVTNRTLTSDLVLCFVLYFSIRSIGNGDPVGISGGELDKEMICGNLIGEISQPVDSVCRKHGKYAWQDHRSVFETCTDSCLGLFATCLRMHGSLKGICCYNLKAFKEYFDCRNSMFLDRLVLCIYKVYTTDIPI